MSVPSLRQVSLWLDRTAPERGAFAHALEWASRLNLPLHAFVPAVECNQERVKSPLPHATSPGEWSGPTLSETLEPCAAACRQHGVPWEVARWKGSVKLGVELFLQPTDLCVFGSDLPHALKNQLLRKSLRTRPTTVLICPRERPPVARVLVFTQQHDASRGFLETVANICRAFACTPVILTVAESAIAAREQQRLAEKIFARQRVPADFDFAAGCDVDTAVTRAVRWRHCTHLFLEQLPASPWRRWFPSNAVERLCRLAESLTVLALPPARHAMPPDADPRGFLAPRALH